VRTLYPAGLLPFIRDDILFEKIFTNGKNVMLQNALWFLAGSGLAFLVSLGFRSREFPTFREWWTKEGMAIWLTVAGVIFMLFITLSGLE
jgi:hypothetical protein